MLWPSRPSFARLAPPAIALACFALALWPRWRDLSATMALADSVGPLLAAARSGWQPHAPPYGWGLTPPYLLILTLSDSLWAAFRALHLLHALAAPLAAWAVLRLRPGAWGAALAAGALIAWDRGLLDTTLSGAEGYLAATWLAACTLGLAARDRPWGPVLAGGAWAMAVHNHPFALATAPLLLILPRRRASLWGLLLLAVLLAPRVLQALVDPAPQAEGDPSQALPAWLQQGGPGAWALLLAGGVGLFSPRTRSLSLATFASAALMLGLGHHLGYLRDHHLRLISVPLVVGLAAAPAGWGLLLLVLLRVPPSWAQPAGHPQRPGTLGMATQLSQALARVPTPLVVDGAWVSGGLVAEPAALMLDRHLRGLPLGGAQVALLLSGKPHRLDALDVPGQVLDRHDHHVLVLLAPPTLEAWRPALCALTSRLGGAADARALEPDLPLPTWTCP